MVSCLVIVCALEKMSWQFCKEGTLYYAIRFIFPSFFWFGWRNLISLEITAKRFHDVLCKIPVAMIFI